MESEKREDEHCIFHTHRASWVQEKTARSKTEHDAEAEGRALVDSTSGSVLSMLGELAGGLNLL